MPPLIGKQVPKTSVSNFFSKIFPEFILVYSKKRLPQELLRYSHTCP